MNIGVEASEGFGVRATRRGLRRSALPFAGGLVVLTVYLLVAMLLIEGLIVLYGFNAPSGNSGDVSLGLPWRLMALTLVLLAVAFVFAAGLVGLLVQSSSSGRRGSLSSNVAAFRSAHWLLLAALVAAPLIAVIAQAATALWLPMLEVLVLAEVLLVYGIYTVPLILDRRLNTWRALAESARLVRRSGFVRQYFLLVLATLATIGLWWVVGPRIVDSVEYSWEPHLADMSSWLSDGSDDERSLFGLTQSSFLVLLYVALAMAATCGAWAAMLAGLYLRARRFVVADDLVVAGATSPDIPLRSRWRVPAGITAALVLMTAAAAFVWCYALPLPEQRLVPGQTVAMRNGLTLTVPGGAHASLYPTRHYPSWLGLGDNGGMLVASFEWPVDDVVAWNVGEVLVGNYSPDEAPSNPTTGPWDSSLIGRSSDGSIEVYWKSGMPVAFALTHLPGRRDGFVQARVTDSYHNRSRVGPSQAMEGLTSRWLGASIRGAQLPAQTAWQSKTVVPGRRTMLSSGISVVMPHRWSAELASTTLSSEPAQMFMPLTLHPQGAWYAEVLSLRGESDENLGWTTDRYESRLVARSADGAVEIYGSAPADVRDEAVAETADTGEAGATRHEHWVAIVVRLSGRAIGLVEGRITTDEVNLPRADALRFARRMWTAYQVEGATLPQLPGG